MFRKIRCSFVWFFINFPIWIMHTFNLLFFHFFIPAHLQLVHKQTAKIDLWFSWPLTLLENSKTNIQTDRQTDLFKICVQSNYMHPHLIAEWSFTVSSRCHNISRQTDWQTDLFKICVQSNYMHPHLIAEWSFTVSSRCHNISRQTYRQTDRFNQVRVPWVHIWI